MPATQARARFVGLAVKPGRRTRIDNLRRPFMADQQDVGQALNLLGIETHVEFPFGHLGHALLQRQFVTSPALQPTGQNGHLLHAKGAQHPPGARRGKQIAFVINHQVLIAADAQLAHGDGKCLGARHHMRQRAGVIGQRLNIEKQRVRHVAGAVFRGHIAQGLLPGGRHTGVDNLDLRVINMFCQPVGGDKKRGGHGCLRFTIHD